MNGAAGELEGRVALVTGAARGIGAVTALALAEEGARVMLADLPGTAVGEVADSITQKGHEAAFHEFDLTEESSVVALINATMERFGRLDVIDNNAGATGLTGKDRDVSELSVDVWDYTMAVNVRGPMLICKHALPIMTAQGGGGSIVNISSGTARAGDVAYVSYACSKGALNTLTRYVATQYGARGIRCNAISPGLISGPSLEAAMPEPIQEIFQSNSLVPRLGQPRDIADLVVFLASDRSAYITGEVISVDGGFFAHLPTLAAIKGFVDSQREK